MTTDVNPNSDEQREEDLKKVIAALFHRTTQVLKQEFPEHTVSGHVRHHNILGPFFAFQLKDETANLHFNCGYTFHELMEKHKDPNRAAQWISSFFVDMVNEAVDKPFPNEPANPEEANALIRDVILPQCMQAIREEFGETKVQVKFGQHQKVGSVIEASIPEVTSGQNSIVLPIQLLLALHLLNRDFPEPIINSLHYINEKAGLN